MECQYCNEPAACRITWQHTLDSEFVCMQHLGTIDTIMGCMIAAFKEDDITA